MTSITLTGWKEFEAKALNMSKLMESDMDEAAGKAARAWEQWAMRDAPKDMGRLGQHISAYKVSPGHWEVASPMVYSPFMEWGTKGRAVIPSEYASYASQFRGSGSGDYYDFLNAILDWVKRKGLSGVVNSYTGKKVGGKAAKENLLVLAEAIAWSIMKKGIHPHPYFFVQKPRVQAQLLADLEQMINTPQ